MLRCIPADSLPMTNVTFWLLLTAVCSVDLAVTRKLRMDVRGMAMSSWEAMLGDPVSGIDHQHGKLEAEGISYMHAIIFRVCDITEFQAQAKIVRPLRYRRT